ncbi:MAG TPA: hypothetical protein VJT10_16610 [Steroidobacteraceae bacterium]|nr:hypothetical protein [Steroidobacteraceae bacterium]
MRNKEISLGWWTIATCVALALAGCDGLSKVGEQESDNASPPQAVVTVIGQPSTVSGDKVTVTMRSGAELTLSGKDSRETVVPILTFDFQPQNEAAEGLKIVQRSKSTISFQIPQAAAQTRYQFRLVVTDSNDATDSQDVEVVAEAVPDPNQFLSYLGAPATFEVVAVTREDLPPCTAPGQTGCLGQDVPFVITVDTEARYWDIDGGFNGPGGAHSAVPIGTTRTLPGAWLASLGSSKACSGATGQNPRYFVPIPGLDADDIAAAVQKSASGRVLDPSRIDEAQLWVTVRISQPDDEVLPVDSVQVCVRDFEETQSLVAGLSRKTGLRPQLAPDGAAMEVQFTTDELLSTRMRREAEDAAQATATQDTKESAAAYYRAIDIPDDASKKSTFLGWLKANAFLPDTPGGAIDWAAVASGSDAHATYVNNFDLGFGRDMYVRKTRCQGNDCDLASVVINYGSLEAAAKKLGPQLAVAMEYSRRGDTGPRFVKFYTYAPDVRCDPRNDPDCSQFHRVSSANLDGRGEKYLPGACTICHGGTPLKFNNANVDEQYGQRSAEAARGDVNAAFLPWDLKSFLFSDDASAGFVDDAANASHHQLWEATRRATQAPSIKALNQLVATTYVDPQDQPNRYALLRELVAGWYEGADFNASFVPELWDADEDQRSLYLDVFAQHCRTCHVAHVPNVDPFQKCDAQSAEPGYSGTNHQIAFACYHQFVNANQLAERLGGAVMPAARLTMDRFWVGADGRRESSAAEQLRTHLANFKPTKAFAPPAPVAHFTGLATRPLIGESLPLDGSSSVLATSYTWSLEKPNGSAAHLVFADTAFPILRDVDLKGEYAVSLSVDGSPPERRAQLRADQEVLPPTETPRPGVVLGQPPRTVNALAGFSGGDRQLHLVQGTVHSADDTVVGAEQVGDQIQLTALSAADADVAVTFSVADVDNDTKPGQLLVSVEASLSANPVDDAVANVRRTGTNVAPTTIEILPAVTRVGAEPVVFCLLQNGDECEEDNQIGPIAGLRGTARLTSVANGTVEYTPPAGVMTRFFPVGSTNSVDLGDADTFRYRVCYENDQRATSCRSNTVQVEIEGRASADPETDAESAISFAQLFDDSETVHSFTAQCSGCHASVDWLTVNNPKDTFCNLTSGRDEVRPFNSLVTYVNRTSPEASALHLKPTGGLRHQQPADAGNGTAAGTGSLHARILRWIEQGAYYTTEMDQSCEP